MTTIDRNIVSENPAGYSTTIATLKLLGRLVTKSKTSPRIRARMIQITRHLPSMDIAGEIAAVWDHILSHVRYIRDPYGVEYVTDPEKLDELVDEGMAAEDCEGMAVYAATLLASAGIPSYFEIQGRDASKPNRFKHCALLVVNPRTKEQVFFDPIGAFEYPESFGLGDTLHKPGEPIEHWSHEGKKVAMSEFKTDDGGLLFELLGDLGLATAALAPKAPPAPVAPSYRSPAQAAATFAAPVTTQAAPRQTAPQVTALVPVSQSQVSPYDQGETYHRRMCVCPNCNHSFMAGAFDEALGDVGELGADAGGIVQTILDAISERAPMVSSEYGGTVAKFTDAVSSAVGQATGKPSATDKAKMDLLLAGKEKTTNTLKTVAIVGAGGLVLAALLLRKKR